MAAESVNVRSAMAIMRKTVSLFGYDGTCLSFNGGKDCTVLLHLLRETFPETYQQIRLVFFKQDNEFPEVDAFIEDMQHKYHLNILVVLGGFKAGLLRLKAETKIQAIFLGTREGDPHSDRLEAFSPTDEDWPSFMRVHPILHWSYAQVWAYLESRPYCSLYDQGYTSLGATTNTRRNCLLKLEDQQYRPAKMLGEGKYERCGRAGFLLCPPTSAAVIGLLGCAAAAQTDQCSAVLRGCGVTVKCVIGVSEDEPLLPLMQTLAKSLDLLVILDNSAVPAFHAAVTSVQHHPSFSTVEQRAFVLVAPSEPVAAMEDCLFAQLQQLKSNASLHNEDAQAP